MAPKTIAVILPAIIGYCSPVYNHIPGTTISGRIIILNIRPEFLSDVVQTAPETSILSLILFKNLEV
jgi:hypothetical protein